MSSKEERLIENVRESLKNAAKNAELQKILDEALVFIEMFSNGALKSGQELVDFVAENRQKLKPEWKFLTEKGATSHFSQDSPVSQNFPKSQLKAKHVPRPQSGRGLDQRSVPTALRAKVGGFAALPRTKQKEADQARYERIKSETKKLPNHTDRSKVSAFPPNVDFIRENIVLCKVLGFVNIRIVEQLSVNCFAKSTYIDVDCTLADIRIWQTVCDYYAKSSRYSAKISTVTSEQGTDKTVLMIEWDQ